jgi:alpha-1,3-mannosyltransferase
MKILHVYNHFYPCVGGIERYIEDLSLELIKRGHKSDVCCLNRCPNSRKKLPSKEEYKGITIYRIPFIDLKYYKIAPSVIKIAKKYDIVHIHGIGFFTDYFCLTKFFHNKPIVVSTVGGVFHTKKLIFFKKLYFNIWCKFLLRESNKTIAISEHDKNLFSKINNNVVIIPVPIDINKFPFKKRKKNNFKLLYIGRISRNKRIDYLIDVIKYISKKQPGAELYIAGEDWEGLRKYLEEKVKILGLEENVKFLGKISEAELKKYIDISTFFVSASEYESFGISAIEAMSAGLIPILNNIESFRYFVKSKENGFIVDYKRPEEVANIIIKIDNKSLQKLSEKARKRVYEFTRENVTKQIEKLYLDILKNN